MPKVHYLYTNEMLGCLEYLCFDVENSFIMAGMTDCFTQQTKLIVWHLASVTDLEII